MIYDKGEGNVKIYHMSSRILSGLVFPTSKARDEKAEHAWVQQMLQTLLHFLKKSMNTNLKNQLRKT